MFFMKDFFEKNKIFIAIIIAAFIIGGFIYLSSFNKSTEGTIEENNQQEENLVFDLDLSSLSYKLPKYTKICLPGSRYDCSSDGCIQNKPLVFVLYNEGDNMVYRCDRNPCDGYKVYKDISGLYINLTPQNPMGAMWKISTDNQYVETVSLGLDFIIYQGKCQDNKQTYP